MIDTAIIALPIALALHVARRHSSQIRALWHDARWYEKAGLLALLAPIPGPVDELVGALVIRRIVARRRSA